MALTIVLHLEVLVATSDAPAPINRCSSEVYPEASRYIKAEVLLHKIGVLTYFLHRLLFWGNLHSQWTKSIDLMSLNVKLLVNSGDDICG